MEGYPQVEYRGNALFGGGICGGVDIGTASGYAGNERVVLVGNVRQMGSVRSIIQTLTQSAYLVSQL